ncbi:transcriptional regulator LysR family [Vibrio maritimus]|uniref:Transcriptional regulator LysR family n=1 Tax=Vibrio maritimus TaxID=990268 RepID=A0A090RRR5_9VIBR|nr:transcriptional regulator LysR family [Vibrio maritimus]
MISIDDMMVFVTVVRYQSFTKAADELNLGKARVSQIVSRLEDSLGSRLLNRTTRSLSLTDFGARYYDKCLTIQDLANEANSDALNASTDISGVIRVSTSIGSEAHINLLGSFFTAVPGNSARSNRERQLQQSD